MRILIISSLAPSMRTAMLPQWSLLLCLLYVSTSTAAVIMPLFSPESNLYEAQSIVQQERDTYFTSSNYSLDFTLYSCQSKHTNRSQLQLHWMMFDRGPFLHSLNSTTRPSSVVLWGSLPNLGIDDRNQFDLTINSTDVEFSDLVAELRGYGISPMLGFVSWDTGTSQPEGWNDTYFLPRLLNQHGLDGAFGYDLQAFAAEDLAWPPLNSDFGGNRQLFLLQPNQPLPAEPSMPYPPPLSFHVMSSVDIGNAINDSLLANHSIPMSWYKFLDSRHVPVFTSSWDIHRFANILATLLSAAQVGVSENVQGWANEWTRRDVELMDRVNIVLTAAQDITSTYLQTFLCPIALPAGATTSSLEEPAVDSSQLPSPWFIAINSSNPNVHIVEYVGPCSNVTQLMSPNQPQLCALWLLANFGDDPATDVKFLSATDWGTPFGPTLSPGKQGVLIDLYSGETHSPPMNCSLFPNATAGTPCPLVYPHIEARSFGALVAVDVSSLAVPEALKQAATAMAKRTQTPLSAFDDSWAPKLQSWTSVHPTAPSVIPPAGMVLVPPSTDYMFESEALLPEVFTRNSALRYLAAYGPVGWDMQYPWENFPTALHGPKTIGVMSRFYIDKFPITNSLFLEFLVQSQLDVARVRARNRNFLRHWVAPDHPDASTDARWIAYNSTIPLLYRYGEANTPAVYITRTAAAAYCSYYGKRLPTEWEWQFAAQGNTTNSYSWGSTLDPSFLPPEQTGPRLKLPQVGQYPKGASKWSGAEDFSGLVWQMTDEYCDARSCGTVLKGGSVFFPVAADDNSRDRLDDEGISKYFPNSARVDVHARVMYRNGGATFDPSLKPGEGLEEVIAGGFPAGTVGFRCVKDTLAEVPHLLVTG